MISVYDDFIRRWQQEKSDMERLGILVPGAALIAEMLRDIEDMQLSHANTVLRINEAAELSGYSTEHLARLVRQGRIPNAGRRGAPRVRIGDIPSSRQFARSRPHSYSVDADVQSILSRRGDR